jgi:4-carboxymuconolactone decarboxylase
MAPDATPVAPHTGERRFGPLPLEEMDPAQRAVADGILAGPRGARFPTLRGPFEALLRSPGLADTAQKLGEHVRFHTAMPPAMNELAIIVTARHWSSQFEWHAHRRLAVEAGIDPAVADAIARRERPELDDDQEAVYEFASQLLTTGGVDDATFAAVRDRWGATAAADLIGVIGYYTLVSFTLNVDRYPIPDGSPPPLS